MWKSRIVWVVLAGAVVAPGCGQESSNPFPVVPVGPEMMNLHVVGNHIENAQGETVHIRGVNRSGSEYQCVKGGSIFDGDWGMASLRAIASWNANAVRIPLNESCWLGLNGAPAANSGENYKDTIKLYVSMLQQFHIIPIVELHWVGPGTTLALGQQPMLDADHAIDFWKDVAQTFADNDGIVFELFNEPFTDSNHESDAAWDCWANGCTADLLDANQRPTGSTYQAVGFTAVVAAIRPIAHNLILLGGIRYSNSLDQWAARAPADSNLAAAWHIYDFNYGTSCDLACVQAIWDDKPAALAATTPIVATEIGEGTCTGGFITPLMQWLDGHGSHYLAWSWNRGGACVPRGQPRPNPFSLIVDYNSGKPGNAYAQTFHDHLLAVTAPAN